MSVGATRPYTATRVDLHRWGYVQSEGLAVFRPASGVSSGLLIALGSRARWPVVSGVIVAVVADHLIMADPSPHYLPSGGTARRVSLLDWS
jgi:hypothetical protein